MKNFEEKLKRLEEIVERLKGGKESLADSLALFEEGIKLWSECQEIINSAEQKVKILLEQDGKEKLVDFQWE